jgi:alanine dehydrogenase
MTRVLFLSEAEVAALLDVGELLEALAGAFRGLSAGRASVPPRIAARAELGMLGAMPVYLPGVALGAKLVTVFPGNHARVLPSHQGLIVLFGEEDGTPAAVMDGRHITAVRTGAAAAVAAGALARADAAVLAILGAGVQGRSHLEALPRVRDFRDIRVASRTPAHAAALASLHPAAHPVASFQEAVEGADVVCCCTDAREPVLEVAWLAPGTHVSSVGGTFGPELDAGTVRAGRVFVEWRRRRHRARRGAGRHPAGPRLRRGDHCVQVDRARGRGRRRRAPGVPPGDPGGRRPGRGAVTYLADPAQPRLRPMHGAASPCPA